VKQIVILGGGSAGWMTALWLHKFWQNINITVIEDSKTPPIIAGEAGSSSVRLFYEEIGIDINDWVMKVNASPKLGSVLNDWNTVGSSFLHSIINKKYLNEISSKLNLDVNKIEQFAVSSIFPIAKLYVSGHLIEQNRTPFVEDGYLDEAMWHFDSRLNADYLKQIAISRGIVHLDKRYVKSTIDGITGDIKSLIFDDATSIDADWFFDCSGFARLLLEKVMGAEYEDVSRFFPASSVVAWWDKPNDTVYTKLNAMKYGWSWNINLRNRTGNGYIYDGSEISLEDAIREVEEKFNITIDPVAKLSFTPNVVKEYWKGNVIGVGLSAGFAEPLESNGLAIVVTEMLNLLSYWNPHEVNTVQRKKFNDKCYSDMDQIIDFLNLHYRGSRTDTIYWKKLKDPNRITEKNKEYIELWKNGFLGSSRTYGEIYTIESYLTVAQGLGLINTDKATKILSYERDSPIAHKHLRDIILKDIFYNIDRCKTMQEWKNNT
jgi:tryptophan halogenase